MLLFVTGFIRNRSGHLRRRRLGPVFAMSFKALIIQKRNSYYIRYMNSYLKMGQCYRYELSKTI